MVVNPVFIQKFVLPLIGGADIDEMLEEFSKYNPDNKEDVKALVENVLIPDYMQTIPPIKEIMKNSLAYYLYNNNVDFESIFDSLLLPFKTPKSSYVFFCWLWEFFFKNEPISYISEFQVCESFDVEAPQKIIEKHKKEK